jgi:hypothetical protein
VSGIDVVLVDLHRGETRLTEMFTVVSNRHVDEAEVHFVARTLAEWSRKHVRRLEDHDSALAGSTWGQVQSLWHSMEDLMASVLGRRGADPLSLLADLRGVYLAASANSLGWEMLAQVAQATRTRELLDLASSCHPQTLRQVRWVNTMIKTLSPQLLASL